MRRAAVSRRFAWGAFAFILVFSIGLPACGPTSRTAVHDAAASRPSAMDYADYALALRRAVRPEGVDYAALVFEPAPLSQFLTRIGSVGPRTTPELFPTQDDRVAYYINAHNALALWAVASWASRGTLPERFVFDPYFGTSKIIDGILRTPPLLRSAALAESRDDPRVRFALCAGHRGDAPLSARPFLPGLLDAQLNQQFADTLSRPQIVQVDHQWQRLMLGAELYTIRGRLVADYERRTGAKDASILNALIDAVPHDRHVILNAAIGYDVARQIYDARVNQIEAPAPQEPGLWTSIQSVVASISNLTP